MASCSGAGEAAGSHECPLGSEHCFHAGADTTVASAAPGKAQAATAASGRTPQSQLGLEYPSLPVRMHPEASCHLTGRLRTDRLAV